MPKARKTRPTNNTFLIIGSIVGALLFVLLLIVLFGKHYTLVNKKDCQYGLFTIDSNGGSIALSSGVQPLDFETTARHELVVRVADSVSGLFRNGRVLIMVSDVNEVL